MTDFSFRITADAAAAFGAIRGVEGQLKTMAGEAKRRSQEMSSSFRDVGRSIRNALAIGGIGLGARELIDMADSVTNLRNRLRGVSASAEEANAKFDRLRQIASNTRADLGSTGEAFVRITRATASLGLSQERVFAMTETLGKAMAQSGASGSEMTAGMLQLAQAMSSGRLQGDELRSVLENIPIVAEAIEKSLGVDRAGLRKLAEEGKITTAVIVEAFEKAKNDIDRGFGNTIPTIGQQMQQLKNDLAVGAGTALASAAPFDKVSKDLETSVRKQREALITGTLAYEDLIKQGQTIKQASAALADANTAAMENARKAFEDFGRAGDIGMARARKAIDDFVRSGSVDELTKKAQTLRQLGQDMFANVQAGITGVVGAIGGAGGAIAEHAKSWRAVKEELSAYQQLLAELEQPEKDAIERYNLLGQLLMNRAISQSRYNEEIEKTRNTLIDLGRIEVKSVTTPPGTPVNDTSGIDVSRLVQQQAESVDYLTDAWHREIKQNRIATEEAQKLGEAFRPAKDALLEMFKAGEFSGQKFLDTLTNISIKLLEMAALQAITDGGSAGGFLTGLLGGNQYGGDHVVQGRPMETFGLPRAQYGADWRIGGPPGPDKTLVAFWASRDESVHVRTPAQRRQESAPMAMPTPVNVAVQVSSDPREITGAMGSYSGQREYVKLNRKFNRRR